MALLLAVSRRQIQPLIRVAVIAVISGFIPEDIPEEVLSCIDLLLPKPVSVETFIALLDGAQQLAETMEGIRQLGEPAAVLR